MIIETVVYCGRLKVFRVLNLNTGTVYSVDYDTHLLAQDSIEHGSIRDGQVVKYVSLELIQATVQGIL